MSYPFKEIENKWHNIWLEKKAFNASDNSSKPKYYALIEFPYPSAEGLHVGHPRSFTAMDIIARKRRMEGYNVLFPIGWDAFGLPAENFAIKHGVHPRESTIRNIANFKRQLIMLGFSFDWDREINTTDPGYYKWTQWIFLRLFDRGLAYKADIPINWCLSCKVGLANEEVINGTCERCGSPVIRKNKNQWMLKITRYADRLISDLEDVDYLEKIKTQQINWIGKSYGAEIDFPADSKAGIRVFTTRPDTIFGATYLVLSPEHPILEELMSLINNSVEVKKYREQASHKSDLERLDLAKEKTGVKLEGIGAVNPATKQKIPIWVSDYVLMGYGTGAIMAVPAHDKRDYEFAKKYHLAVQQVISGGDISVGAYEGDGPLINSDFLNGSSVQEAKKKIIDWLAAHEYGAGKINYRLRDWVFSRQRYWGEVIPMVQCETCGWVPVPEHELPVLLPEVKSFISGEDGKSVLEGLTDWVNTKCPGCGGPAKRETDTMPQWAGSSWYFLRYIDPHNNGEFASVKTLDYWLPVDWYNGGMEHTTLHLLYSRFWHKFLYDEGLVPCKEPYKKRTSHGMILGADGEKMSKSRGNVVNPDDIANEFGADVFRVYLMFIGAFDLAVMWNTEGLVGISRFLNRVWSSMEKIDNDISPDEKDLRLMHKTIKNVSERIEKMRFNTAVAEIMSYTNGLSAMAAVPKEMFQLLCVLLYPFAPHMTSEMWEMTISKDAGVMDQKWPEYDRNLITDETATIAVQVNGKLRGTLEVEKGMSQDSLFELTVNDVKFSKYIHRNGIKKVIFVPDKLLNIVIGK
ncbi:MAG TPA: leucine--tRNA ligase [Dissulfurispiraceae bacterium]|nr:leucine--tRNA ligase [Dissulfurispiraceae bacterium]